MYIILIVNQKVMKKPTDGGSLWELFGRILIQGSAEDVATDLGHGIEIQRFHYWLRDLILTTAVPVLT